MNSQFGDGSARAITDNDTLPTVISTTVGQPSRPADGHAVLTVTLSTVSGQNVVVPYSTGGVTATSGSTGTTPSTSGTLNIPAGSLTATINVTLRGDNRRAQRDVQPDAGSASGATIADGLASGPLSTTTRPRSPSAIRGHQ